jgi:PAS domain S-box-containing protein
VRTRHCLAHPLPEAKPEARSPFTGDTRAMSALTGTGIEDRKRVEQAARGTESELREVIETIPAIAWIARPDGTEEFNNRRWQEYTGFTAGQANGDGWQQAVHPDDLTSHYECWQESVVTGRPFESEARYRAADGTYRWFLVRGEAMRDSEGRILRWYGLLTDIDDHKRTEDELRHSAARLQQLSRHVLEVQEEERRQLSRELHDEFGQLLATINLHLHKVRATAGDASQASIEESMTLLKIAGNQVRNLALELRPIMLETAGLDATLRWLAEQQQSRTGIPIEVLGQLGDVPGPIAIACFRVAQQALTNVVQHAWAKHAWIELDRDDNLLVLVIRDDGIGFDVTSAMRRAMDQGHLGLAGMRERVQILGGKFWMDSNPGKGTRITASLPLA